MNALEYVKLSEQSTQKVNIPKKEREKIIKYCDECDCQISGYEWKKNQGLCNSCMSWQ